jgi:hypothetical protein
MRSADCTPFARSAKGPEPHLDAVAFAASVLITLAVVGQLADVAERTGVPVVALAGAFVAVLAGVFRLVLGLVRGGDPRAMTPPSK